MGFFSRILSISKTGSASRAGPAGRIGGVDTPALAFNLGPIPAFFAALPGLMGPRIQRWDPWLVSSKQRHCAKAPCTGGMQRTILEACEYMAAIGKERELRPHWQQVRELMLQEVDVAAVSWRVRLAVLKDAKLDVSALSEPPT